MSLIENRQSHSERRSSILTKIFKPQVNDQKGYVPMTFGACDQYQPRRGKLDLGRCAKCNFREEEHRNSISTNPLFAHVSHLQEIEEGSSDKSSDDEQPKAKEALPENERFVESKLEENNDDDEKRDLEEKVSSPNVKQVATAFRALATYASREAAEQKSKNDKATVTPAEAEVTEQGNQEDEKENSGDETGGESQQDEEEEEEEVERPSWAPPPLLNINDSAPSTPPKQHLPRKSPIRKGTISWLKPKPRSASSASSDMSSSSSVGGNSRQSLRLLASQIRSKMNAARETWESKIGDSLPKCNRCGRLIDPHHKIITAGMERFHEICPTREESERGPRNCRYMVQKAHHRLVLKFLCDGDTKQPYTFMYDLDTSTKQKCLRLPNTAPMVLVYHFDSTTHASLERKFRPPKNREFDLSVRYLPPFIFENPATNNQVAPTYDAETKKVTIVKFYSSNGVLHEVEASFNYDEEKHVLSPDRLELRFSMMPGTQAKLPVAISSSRRKGDLMIKG